MSKELDICREPELQAELQNENMPVLYQWSGKLPPIPYQQSNVVYAEPMWDNPFQSQASFSQVAQSHPNLLVGDNSTASVLRLPALRIKRFVAQPSCWQMGLDFQRTAERLPDISPIFPTQLEWSHETSVYCKDYDENLAVDPALYPMRGPHLQQCLRESADAYAAASLERKCSPNTKAESLLALNLNKFSDTYQASTSINLTSSSSGQQPSFSIAPSELELTSPPSGQNYAPSGNNVRKKQVSRVCSLVRPTYTQSRYSQLTAKCEQFNVDVRYRCRVLCGGDCQVFFKDALEFAQHLDKVHSSDYRELLCPDHNCAWSVIGFHKQQQLKRHLQGSHIRIPYSCAACGSTFNYSWSLRRHKAQGSCPKWANKKLRI